MLSDMYREDEAEDEPPPPLLALSVAQAPLYDAEREIKALLLLLALAQLLRLAFGDAV